MFSRISNIFIVSIMLIALVGVFQTTAAETTGGKCKPVNGHFRSQAVPCTSPDGLLCTEGRLFGGIKGDYEATYHQLYPCGTYTLGSILYRREHYPYEEWRLVRHRCRCIRHQQRELHCLPHNHRWQWGFYGSFRLSLRIWQI